MIQWKARDRVPSDANPPKALKNVLSRFEIVYFINRKCGFNRENISPQSTGAEKVPDRMLLAIAHAAVPLPDTLLIRYATRILSQILFSELVGPSRGRCGLTARPSDGG